jgi:tetratricopeptide (TPR) repeat protein
MKKLLLSILILILSLSAGYSVLSIWIGVSLYRENPSRGDLEKAIKLTPSNPDPYHRLALFHEWNIPNIDLKQSLHFLKKAIEHNPLEQQYWIHLAKILFRTGEKEASRKALEKAVSVFPTGYQGRWVSGNLLLQQGAVEKAIPHFTYILSHYPNQGYLVYEVLRKAFSDPDFVFERIVPKDPASTSQYLAYLYEIGDKESAQKVWRRKVLLGHQVGRDETLRHIEFLISRGELSEAFGIWKARLGQEGLSLPAGGNLITNGGFEKDAILGGGFDWKISQVAGAEVSFDPSNAFEGKRSLKIAFSGKENLDFHHVSQYVALKPDTDYLLKAQVKTREVTTKSGLKMEVLGVGSSFYKSSESFVGDNDWKEMEVVFRAPTQSRGGLVRFRREKTDKFDRLISGTVWIDNVTLKEKGRYD